MPGMSMVGRRIQVLPLGALLLAMALFVAARAEGQSPRPARILVTNDDGIDAPGLAALRRALKPLGEVVVAAPAVNASGASQSTRALIGVFATWPYREDGRVVGWAVDGTPADATRFGVVELGGARGFDVVVSGINNGANLGALSHYSGTVGAAMEAAKNGIPGIAVSQASGNTDYMTAAALAAEITRRVLRGEGPGPGVVLNVNVPPSPVKGLVVRAMGSSYITLRGHERVSVTADTVRWRARLEVVRVLEEGTDTRAFQDGWAVVTPLLFDWTAEGAMGKLEGWGLRVRPRAR